MNKDTEAPERIRVGPTGWSYQDWAGQVYPKPKLRGFDPLSYLAQYFDVIKINSTFYRIPDAKTTWRWVERVDDYPNFDTGGECTAMERTTHALPKRREHIST
jgi:hypothetical protein